MNTNNNALEWLKTHWIQILIGFIVFWLILSILKVIATIFNGNGPIPNGIGKAIGAGANLVNGIANNCSTQADCSKSTEETSCDKLQGCGWNTPAEADKKATCINTTGKNTGQGGFFSLTCGLGIGALAYLGALLVAPIAGLLTKVFTKPKPNVSTISQLTDKSIDNVIREIFEKAKPKAASVVDKAKAKNGGEIDKARQENIGRKMGIRVTHNTAVNAVNGQSNLSPEEAAAQKATITQETEKAEQEAQKEAEQRGINEEAQKEDDNNIDEEAQKVEE